MEGKEMMQKLTETKAGVLMIIVLARANEVRKQLYDDGMTETADAAFREIVSAGAREVTDAFTPNEES